ncbi:protein ROOT HAIR DEFECTIVE 3-like [Impatiens glandulifera]|uniref:protein ROOT HAIR DEFECTIVE 3-like n=1 Tax=Impatiens glandulifera TaxID=253017 RepID=UPI001FB14B39|nr:protein ROOT HAIR DEFECTIVE 3-like [Impatiens glandulifera]
MGEEEIKCVSAHLIDGDGNIDEKGLIEFSELTSLSKSGLNYTTVAIMGPQSSGKSTLLNHLFKSNFRMMDAEKGRTQTTHGIWLAKSPILDRCTIIMDLEGSNGREQGDDHNFQMKIALFSLCLSDIVLINTWFQDVGRDKSANKPLLRIIFQTPLVLLSASLLKDTLEIWNNFPKPKDKQDASFYDYFVLDVVGLSHYQYAKDKFIEDVNELRKRFSSPSEASLQTKPLVPAVDFVRSTSEIWDRVVNDKALDIPSHKVMIAKVRCEQINNDKFNAFVTNEEWSQLKVTTVNIPPVSCFGIKITSMVDKCLAEYDEEAEFYDEVVKADHREKLKQRLLQVTIAKVRCEEIDNDKFNGFIANEEWSQLKVAVNSPPVPCFGIKVTSMVDKCLAEYNKETEFYDEMVKVDHREKLKQRLLQEIKPILGSLMDNISSQALDAFKFILNKDLNGGKKFREIADWSYILVKFDSDYKDSKIEQSEWTSTKVRDKLVSQLSCYVNCIRPIIQNELTNQVKLKLEGELTESMRAILNKPGNNMWVNLRDLFRRETESACSEFRVGLEDLGTNIDTAKVEAEAGEMLKEYGRDIIEKSVRKESDNLLRVMHQKFCYILLNEPDSDIPRSWKGSDKIQVIVKTARVECINIMSVMAIMRLDINKESDHIQQILHNALLEEGGEGSLFSNNWNGVEASKTLMSPAACATIWDQFLKSTGIIIASVNQAIQARIDADNNQCFGFLLYGKYVNGHISLFELIGHSVLQPVCEAPDGLSNSICSCT